MDNNGEKIKILYVEDDKYARAELEGLAKITKQNAFFAENGKEGLSMFVKYRPDIVVSDISMPVMSGLEMAKHIKELSPDTPIIIVTAHSDSHLLIGAIEIGVEGFLLKPLDVEKLLTKLDTMELMLSQRSNHAKYTLLAEQIKTEALQDFIAIKD